MQDLEKLRRCMQIARPEGRLLRRNSGHCEGHCEHGRPSSVFDTHCFVIWLSVVTVVTCATLPLHCDHGFVDLRSTVGFCFLLARKETKETICKICKLLQLGKADEGRV